jgi:hypothetical protein
VAAEAHEQECEFGLEHRRKQEVRLRRFAWSAYRVKISNTVIINCSYYL